MDTKPDKVITCVDEVTTAWLTSVLASSGALIHGAVATFEVNPGRGNWSTNAMLNLRYVDGSQGVLPQRSGSALGFGFTSHASEIPDRL